MRDFIEDMGIATLFLIVIIAVVLGLIFGIGWISSCKQKGIYNKINNTQFTCSDFFWAGEQINSNTQTIKLK